MKRREPSIRLLAVITGTVTACLMAIEAFALDPHKTMTQFKHRSWGAADGIDRAHSIAQTQDGYIWIGAVNGLFRFDGLAFKRWASKQGEPEVTGLPWAMMGSKDGSLWIGTERNVYQLNRGTMRLCHLKDGSRVKYVREIYEAKDGSIWFSGRNLVRFAEGQMEAMGPESGLPDRSFNAAVEDAQGTLWVSMTDSSEPNEARGSFAFRRKGEAQFQLPPQRFRISNQLQVQGDGRIWSAETGRSLRAFHDKGTEVEFLSPEIQVGSQDMLFDRDGAFWITSLGDGLRRVADTAALGTNSVSQSSTRIDKFLRKDGLSSDIIYDIMEDLEGNIWVGTSSGVDCFSENRITSISAREGLPFDQGMMVESTGDGSIWAASFPRGFAQLTAGSAGFADRKWLGLGNKTNSDPAVPPRPEMFCLFKTPQGELLAGTGIGLIQIQTNGAGKYFEAPGDVQFNKVGAMTVDREGGLWISDYGKGNYRVHGGKTEKVPQVEYKASVAHCDDIGRLWFGHIYGGLSVYESGRCTEYQAGTNGLLPGAIRAILSEPGGKVWLVGDGGLCLSDGKGFKTLNRKNGLPGDNWFAAVKDDSGNYWIAGMDAIFSVTPDNLAKAVQADTKVVFREMLDFSDGLRGFIRPPMGNPDLGHPLAAKGLDGRVWFSSGTGLAVVNPRSIPWNAIPPPVHIERVMADNRVYQKGRSLELPMGTRSCQIDYVGLSFVDPAKVRYRYKLENHDQDWVEAGPNRQAFYSNLKPRKYRFQVAASNNDGVWNEKGDSIEFAILPAFYETAWFPPLCSLPAAILVWGLYRLRLARVTSRMKQQLEGQIKERKRIAQELHDTLLQGFTGIGLKLDAIATRLPESVGEAKEQLRSILNQSDRYLTEARRSVWQLRATSLVATDDFGQVLSEAGERIVEGTGIRLNFSVVGEVRKLSGAIEDNLLRICEEAVTNAIKHARPTEVKVDLEFSPQKVALRIKDNGCGFDPRGPEATKSGHFGLSGLQERVRALAGSVSINSQTGKGTEIRVSIDTM